MQLFISGQQGWFNIRKINEIRLMVKIYNRQKIT